MNLAYTHRTFRNIVREIVVRNAAIPLRSIRHFIVFLSENPGWAKSIRKIELLDGSERKPGRFRYLRTSKEQASQVCRTLIPTAFAGSDAIRS